MEMSVEQFLDSMSNKSTKNEYRWGVKLFCEWYGKTAEEILELRKSDLTQIQGENLVEYRNRAARFEKEIEKFHSYLKDHKGYTINTSRNLTLGIRQLFRYYEMSIKLRNGSKVSETVESTKDFPLQIEHVRAMFKVADLRERVILSLATDLGLRMGDFISLRKVALPDLSQEAPISFVVMTDKEKILAKGFLSQESVDLLKLFLPTLEKRAEEKRKQTKKEYDNPFLFPSNGKSHISDEWTNQLLKDLAGKAGIALGDKSLHFHCFRKMFLSAAIDSGAGLTAGKMMCGKSIARSDSTYLTVVKLKDRFVQLKKFLSIQEQPRVETEKLETLKTAIIQLQEKLTVQEQITQTISEENINTKQKLEKLEVLIDYLGSFKPNEELKTYLMDLETANGSMKGVYVCKKDQSLSGQKDRVLGTHKMVVDSQKVEYDSGQTAKTIGGIELGLKKSIVEPKRER